MVVALFVRVVFIGDFYGTTEAIKMKFGMRTPSIKKSIKERTTGKAKRVVKKALILGYGIDGEIEKEY